MEDVTLILNAMRDGENDAQDRLMEAVYEELRRMAAGKMKGERPSHTLGATALVHEAWMRLGEHQDWENRKHFFGAAAEAMRRILVESARKHKRIKRGGGVEAVEFHESQVPGSEEDDRVLQVHEVLDQLAVEDEFKAEIVKLRFFVGLPHAEIAKILRVNEKTVRRHWNVAKVWLFQAIRDGNTAQPEE